MRKFNFLILGFCLFIFSSCEKDAVDSVENEQQLSHPVLIKKSAVSSTSKIDYGGTKLTYYGNNYWYGSFGVICWFYGVAPSQIQWGQRSSWQMVASPINALYYEENGVSSWGGDRLGFHVNLICTSGPKIEKIFKVNKTILINGDVLWSVTSTTVSSFGGPGNCNFEGKIVLDKDCNPIIVTKDSDMPIGCMQDDEIIQD